MGSHVSGSLVPKQAVKIAAIASVQIAVISFDIFMSFSFILIRDHFQCYRLHQSILSLLRSLYHICGFVSIEVFIPVKSTILQSLIGRIILTLLVFVFYNECKGSTMAGR